MLEKKQDHEFHMAQLNFRLAQTQAAATNSIPAGYSMPQAGPSGHGRADLSQIASYSTSPSSTFNFDYLDYDLPLPLLPGPGDFNEN
jgi:hypothetical protein